MTYEFRCLKGVMKERHAGLIERDIRKCGICDALIALTGLFKADKFRKQ